MKNKKIAFELLFNLALVLGSIGFSACHQKTEVMTSRDVMIALTDLRDACEEKGWKGAECGGFDNDGGY